MPLHETIKTLRLYVIRCLQRAFWGSLSSALNWAGIVGVGAVGGYLGRISDPQTWQQVVTWALVYTAAAWLIIFLFRLFFIAPFQTFKDIEGQRVRLEQALEDRERRQRALNLLWDLRESGVQIRNEFPVNFPNWHRRVYEWRDQLLDASGVLSVNLRRHLQTLNETHGYPSDIQIVGENHKQEHDLDLRVISEMLRRLERYLERDL
jgi:hypothetical protein